MVQRWAVWGTYIGACVNVRVEGTEQRKHAADVVWREINAQSRHLSSFLQFHSSCHFQSSYTFGSLGVAEDGEKPSMDDSAAEGPTIVDSGILLSVKDSWPWADQHRAEDSCGLSSASSLPTSVVKATTVHRVPLCSTSPSLTHLSPGEETDSTLGQETETAFSWEPCGDHGGHHGLGAPLCTFKAYKGMGELPWRLKILLSKTSRLCFLWPAKERASQILKCLSFEHRESAKYTRQWAARVLGSDVKLGPMGQKAPDCLSSLSSTSNTHHNAVLNIISR